MEPETTDAGPDTLPGEPTAPYVPTFTGELPAQPDPVQPLAAETEPPSRAAARPRCSRSSCRAPTSTSSAGRSCSSWPGCGSSAAAVGLGLYYWWFHSLDKTPPVFVVLVFLVVCTVGSLLTAMVSTSRWCRRWPSR